MFAVPTHAEREAERDEAERAPGGLTSLVRRGRFLALRRRGRTKESWTRPHTCTRRGGRSSQRDASAGRLSGRCVVTPAELPSSGDSRPAAVLCLLFEKGGEANVALTWRLAHFRPHAGEVSFPGGRLQTGELSLRAALREAKEEIGVEPAAVAVIGELTPLTTVRSPALVHCFVARLTARPARDEWRFVPDARELEKVFWLPLARPAARDVYHEELWPAPGPVGGPLPGRSVFPLGGRRCLGCDRAAAYRAFVHRPRGKK